MPVRLRASRRGGATIHCVCSGTKKLPFAGCSVVLAFAPFVSVGEAGSLQIVWDDLRLRRADIWHVTNEEPQATKFKLVTGGARELGNNAGEDLRQLSRSPASPLTSCLSRWS
jgi:hypothetical protein